jgi:hypothetical protein
MEGVSSTQYVARSRAPDSLFTGWQPAQHVSIVQRCTNYHRVPSTMVRGSPPIPPSRHRHANTLSLPTVTDELAPLLVTQPNLSPFVSLQTLTNKQVPLPATQPTFPAAPPWDFCYYKTRHIWLRRNGGVGEGFNDLEIHTTHTRQYGLELSLKHVWQWLILHREDQSGRPPFPSSAPLLLKTLNEMRGDQVRARHRRAQDPHRVHRHGEACVPGVHARVRAQRTRCAGWWKGNVPLGHF